jgi:sphingolipid delta-4 desaturase
VAVCVFFAVTLFLHDGVISNNSNCVNDDDSPPSEAHPEIQKFFVTDHSFKWKVTALVLFQYLSIYLFQDLSFSAVFALAYVLGGTVNHSLMLSEHEIGHCQAFGHQYPRLNRWFGIFANLPIGVPMACSFKKYHNLHHRFQGLAVFPAVDASFWSHRPVSC